MLVDIEELIKHVRRYNPGARPEGLLLKQIFLFEPP